MISTQAIVLTAIVSWFLPLAGSFVSRQHWPSELTALATVVLSVLTGIGSEWISDPNSYSWSWAGVRAIGVVVLAAIARSQFWRKTTTDAKVLAFPRKLPPNNTQPGFEPAELTEAARAA